MFFPDPDGMVLQDWADAVSYSMINYPNAWPLNGANWQEWGMMFFHDPYLSRYDPPNPYNYNTWEDWGRKLADSMSAAPAAANVPGNPGISDLGTFIITQAGEFITTQAGEFLITQ